MGFNSAFKGLSYPYGLYEGIWRNVGIAPLILKLGTIWMCVVSLMTWPFHPWERAHQYL